MNILLLVLLAYVTYVRSHKGLSFLLLFLFFSCYHSSLFTLLSLSA
jgi:hypothetical protein